MAFNALIAQGVRPIGADVPQIANMLQEKQQAEVRNALAQRQDERAQGAYDLQQRRYATEQDNLTDQHMTQLFGVLVQNLDQAKGTPQYEQILAGVAASPNFEKAKSWAASRGIDLQALRDPSNIPVVKAQAGIKPEAPKYTALGANGALKQNPDGTTEVVGAPAAKPPAESADMQAYREWQKGGGKGSYIDYRRELAAAEARGQATTAPRFGAVQEGVNPETGKPGSYIVDSAGNMKWLPVGPKQKDPMAMRKEFDGLPSVQNYKTVLPLYQRALTAPNTRAGDISIVYALGKMFDPNSVVREGELKLSAGAAPWVVQLAGQIKSQLGNGGALQPSTRAEIIDALKGQLDSLASAYKQDRERFAGYATGMQVDPNSVVGPDPAAAFQGQSRTVVRTGTLNGRKVVQYSDGTTDYAD